MAELELVSVAQKRAEANLSLMVIRAQANHWLGSPPEVQTLSTLLCWIYYANRARSSSGLISLGRNLLRLTSLAQMAGQYRHLLPRSTSARPISNLPLAWRRFSLIKRPEFDPASFEGDVLAGGKRFAGIGHDGANWTNPL